MSLLVSRILKEWLVCSCWVLLEVGSGTKEEIAWLLVPSVLLLIAALSTVLKKGVFDHALRASWSFSVAKGCPFSKPGALINL